MLCIEIRTLLNTKPALKLVSAIELYKSGDVSISRAAELSGMNLEYFKRVLFERCISRKLEPDRDINKKIKEITEWRK